MTIRISLDKIVIEDHETCLEFNAVEIGKDIFYLPKDVKGVEPLYMAEIIRTIFHFAPGNGQEYFT